MKTTLSTMFTSLMHRGSGHMQITYEGRGFVDFTFRRRGRKVFHVHAYCSSPAKALQTSARRGSVTPTHIPTGGKDKCHYSQLKEAHTTFFQKKETEFGISRSAYVSQSVHKRPSTCYSMLLNQSGRQQRGCVVTVCYLLYPHLILNQS